MSCLDSATLWAMHAGELSGDELAAARAHARTCLACETSRRALSQTRQLLSVATSAPLPNFRWKKVDAAVDDAVTAEAARALRKAGAWRLLWIPALATAAAALLFFTRPVPTAKELAPIAGASVVIAAKQELAPQRDAVVAVKPKKAPALAPRTFATANGSRFELAAGASARKTGSNAVQLSRGEAFINGKQGVVVVVGSSRVRAEQDAVFIASSELDVAVAEGAVLVARDDGSSVVVNAGESYVRGAVVRADTSARFAGFGFAVKKAPASEPERSADIMFIQRAQLSLKSGKCGEFLLGLETLAFDAESPLVRARARITKARCHDERLEPQKAAIEYARYVRDFPDGDAAAEARAALARQ